jgi:hypothetical protein
MKKAAPKSDPKEDPDFKRVVQHFLSTPAKPHKFSKSKRLLTPGGKPEKKTVRSPKLTRGQK